MSEVQSEAQQLLYAIQTKLQEDSIQLNIVNTRLQTKERDNRVIDLVQKELSTIKPEHSAYKSIGKMFLYTPTETMKTELEDKKKENLENIQALKKKGEFLSKRVNETQAHLNDVFQNIKK
ncbi:Prefoldin [Conidiobolus coronatus NRRL 28638]|uniref:Prefoldin n=1 Tax=Conidiobolus coronatus (strain ATCC 28846 / CBS 209.66 / NRRL 28638) TaxID=796925 RepID=A0A137PBS7_CONC2|nr:Prefoldin [Conidiobolus coronatus NRRL 28638]|eukprot:KXN72435.1 Prefoldin [Conidiobolus coronatus NRRL 28638]